MPNVGDSTIASTKVRPADDTTALTLKVRRGDDTLIASVPVSKTRDEIVDGVREQTWTADAATEYTVAGEWVFTWDNDGTGAGLQELAVQVAPNAATSDRRSYATTADYAQYLGTAPPAGARQKLIEASAAVDDMLFGAYYQVVDGLPVDADHVAAIKNATCAQADDTAAEAKAAAGGGSFTIGKISVTRPASIAVSAPRPGVFYSAAAWRILHHAGLTGHEPWAC